MAYTYQLVLFLLQASCFSPRCLTKLFIAACTVGRQAGWLADGSDSTDAPKKSQLRLENHGQEISSQIRRDFQAGY